MGAFASPGKSNKSTLGAMMGAASEARAFNPRLVPSVASLGPGLEGGLGGISTATCLFERVLGLSSATFDVLLRFLSVLLGLGSPPASSFSIAVTASALSVVGAAP